MTGCLNSPAPGAPAVNLGGGCWTVPPTGGPYEVTYTIADATGNTAIASELSSQTLAQASTATSSPLGASCTTAGPSTPVLVPTGATVFVYVDDAASSETDCSTPADIGTTGTISLTLTPVTTG
ncbi:MAG: hypothetical protein ACYDAQ_04915 [Mycobacteriales bacterium]